MSKRVNWKWIFQLAVSVLLVMGLGVQARAAENPSAKEAEELFRKVYNMVMGPQGSSFSYKANIIGVYKTEGTVVYKGKKSHFTEPRYMAWDNGTTSYRVDLKKQAVNIYRSDDERQHRYLSKFKYDLENFNYSYVTKGDFYEVTMKSKNTKFFGVREAKVMVRRANLHPESVTVKVAFMSATLQISQFQSGNISDDRFVFPADTYRSYTHNDHRNEYVK